MLSADSDATIGLCQPDGLGDSTAQVNMMVWKQDGQCVRSDMLSV